MPWTKERLCEQVISEFRAIFGFYPTDLPREEIEAEATFWDPFEIIVPSDEMPSFIDFVQARLVTENEKEKRK